jgi:hypothetical protein
MRILISILLVTLSFSHQLKPIKEKESRACLRKEEACWSLFISKTEYSGGKESIFTFGMKFVQKDTNVLTENRFCELTLSLLKDSFSCKTVLNYSSDKTSFEIRVFLSKKGKRAYLSMDPPGERADLCTSSRELILTLIPNRSSRQIFVGIEKKRAKIRAVIVADGKKMKRGRWLNLQDILKCGK